MKVSPCNDSPWIHFIQVTESGGTMSYISPYQVVSVLVSDETDFKKAKLEFSMSDGTRHLLRGNLAANAARVFQGIGIVASIAEDAVDGRSDDGRPAEGGAEQ
jgi:hypothetical protein